ncbi:putative leucine-rich repeat-containing protein DDB_G0290503 [Tigriopus californicus]|uniref:putative leucine-rich repeat-containing protein DDB_G0290503 n=1 Tax=Tigriopus californicus TaxID=6832 RepID=UPI0027D9E34F|nr:putative leucine-rich repeat-containing protein DDB_G0290503 [Tigriopus californicus]
MAFVGTEGWKSGLSAIQVAKVEELESKFDHLKKENGRKQLHMDNLQQELEKNKRKTEDEKNSNAQLQREITTLRENCDGLQNQNSRLEQDLGKRDNQIQTLQNQVSLKDKQLQDMSEELKRAKKEVGEFENQLLPMSAPSFATPQKRESFIASNKGLNGSACWSSSGDEDVRKKLDDALKRLKEKDEEIDHLQKEVFEMQFTATKDFEAVSSNALTTNAFDDMPLPTSSKTNSITTKDEIAERSKTSSIAFSWGATPPNRKPSKATPMNQSIVQTPAQAQTTERSNIVAPSSGKIREVDQKRIMDLENTLLKAKKDHQDMQMKHNALESGLAIKEKEVDDMKAKLLNSIGSAQHKLEVEQLQAKIVGFESKLKALQTDFDCQRQNGETTKLHLEQKLKELDREAKRDVHQAQSELRTMEKQASKLEDSLRQAENLAKDAANKFEAEKGSLEKDIQNLKEQLQSEIEKGRLTSQQFSTDIKTKQEEILALKKEKDGIEGQFISTQKELADKLKTITGLEERISTIKADMEHVETKQKEEMGMKSAEFQTQIEELKKENSAIVKQHEDQIKQILDGNQKKIEEGEAAVEALKKAEANWSEKEQFLLVELEEVKNVNDQLKNIDTDWNEKLKTKEVDFSNLLQEKSALENQLKENAEILKKAEAEYSILKLAEQQYLEDFKKLEVENEAMKNEKNAFDVEAKEREEQLQNLQKEIESLNQQDTSNKRELVRMEGELDSMKTAHANLDAKEKGFMEQLETWEREKMRIDELKQEHEESLKQMSEELNCLKTEKSQLEETQKELDGKLVGNDNKLSQLQEEREVHATEFARLSEEHSALKANKLGLIHELESSSVQFRALEETLKQEQEHFLTEEKKYKSSLELLESQGSAFQQKIADLQIKNNQLLTMVSDLENRLSEHSIERAELQKAKEAMAVALEGNKSVSDTKESLFQSLHAQTADQQVQVRGLENKVSTLESSESYLIQGLTVLRCEHQFLEDQLNDQNEEMSKIKSSLSAKEEILRNKIDEIARLNQALQVQSTETASSQQSFRDKLASAEANLQDMKASLLEAKNQEALLLDDVERLTVSLAEKEDQLKSLNVTNVAIQESLDLLMAEKESNQKTIEDMINLQDELKIKLDLEASEKRQLSLEFEALSQDHTRSLQETKESAEIAADIRQKLQDQILRLESKIDEDSNTKILIDQLTQESKAHHDQLLEVQSQFDQAQKNYEESRRKCSDFEEQQVALLQQIQCLEEEKSALSTRLEEGANALEELKQTKDLLEKAKEQSKATISQLEKRQQQLEHKINSLESSDNAFIQSMTILRCENRFLEDQLIDLKAIRESENKDTQVLKKNTEQKMAEYECLLKENELKMQGLRAIAEKVESRKLDFATDESYVSQLQTTKEQAERSQLALKSTIRQLERTRAALEVKLESMESNDNGFIQSMTILKCENQYLVDQLADLKSQLDIKLKDDETMETNKSKIQALEKQLEETKSSLATKTAQLEANVQSLETLESQAASLNTELESVKATLVVIQDENVLLKDNLLKANAGIELQSAEMKELKDTLEEKVEALDELKTYVSESEEMLENVIAEKEQCHTEVEELTKNVDNLKSKLQSQGEEVDLLTGQINDKNNSIQKLTEESSQRESDMDARILELESKLTTQSVLSETIESLQNACNLAQSELADLKLEMTRLQSLVQDSETKYQLLVDEKSAVLQQLENLAQEKKELDKGTQKKDAVILDLEAAKLEIQTNYDESKESVDRLQGITNDLKEQLDQSKIKLAEKETQINNLNQEVDETQKQLKESQTNQEESSQSLETLASKMAQSEADLKILQREKNTISVQLEEATSQLTAALEKCDILESEKKVLEGAKTDLHTKVKRVLSTLKIKENELVQLAEENDKLNQNLSDQKKSLQVKQDEIDSQLKNIAKLEAEYGHGEPRALPWEDDEDCQEMRPTELLEFFGESLNVKEKQSLYELCLDELKKEVRTKSRELLKVYDGSSALKRELERANMKLNCANTTAGEGSGSGAAIASSAARMTRSHSSTALAKENQSLVEPLKTTATQIAAEHKKRIFSPEKSPLIKPQGKKTRIFSPKVAPNIPATRNRTRKSLALTSQVPENPFKSKKLATDAKSSGSKPLDTITNIPEERGPVVTKSNGSSQKLLR